MVSQATKQRTKSGDQDSQLVEMRAELARTIAAHAQVAGEQPTAVPGLLLYQGRKCVNLGGMTYLCDESTFLLTSVDLPVNRDWETTVGLLKSCSRLLDLLDTPGDIPFLGNLMQRDRVPLTSRSPGTTSPRNCDDGRAKSQDRQGDRLAPSQLR
jgi:hypothetical protein